MVRSSSDDAAAGVSASISTIAEAAGEERGAAGRQQRAHTGVCAEKSAARLHTTLSRFFRNFWRGAKKVHEMMR